MNTCGIQNDRAMRDFEPPSTTLSRQLSCLLVHLQHVETPTHTSDNALANAQPGAMPLRAYIIHDARNDAAICRCDTELELIPHRESNHTAKQLRDQDVHASEQINAST